MYCSNKKDGCTWKEELKNLSGHINKDKREGDCQFQVVKCHYWSGLPFQGRCYVKRRRADLANHEEKECQRRHYTCQYQEYIRRGECPTALCCLLHVCVEYSGSFVSTSLCLVTRAII